MLQMLLRSKSFTDLKNFNRRRMQLAYHPRFRHVKLQIFLLKPSLTMLRVITSTLIERG
jgi:hypothetical protein